MKDIKFIFNQFRVDGNYLHMKPISTGHINDTYLVKTSPAECDDYILQKINNDVFKNVPELQDNIVRVTRHLQSKPERAEKEALKVKALQLIPCKDQKSYFLDQDGKYWRVTVFIPNAMSYDKVPSAKMNRKAGAAFGNFIKLLSDLPGKPLYNTIPDFHNMPFRLQQFEQALRSTAINIHEVEDEIRFVEQRAGSITKLYEAGENGTIRKCVTHNDTKINNILFDKENQEPIAIIDLDTVMTGLPHYDFGDAVRTSANNGNEDERDLSRVSLNLPYFEHFTEGFLSGISPFLSYNEAMFLPEAARYMTFIMGLRFFTDYLNGNTYYKIKYSGHNLTRTKAQFKLVKSIEEHMVYLEDYVERYLIKN